MTQPPTFTELVDWLDGRLSPDEAGAVATNVARADRETAANVAWLRRFMQARESVQIAAPPPALRADLRAQFSAFAAGRRPQSPWRRLVAALTLDSGLSPALPMGARGLSTPGRQHLYTADGIEIALEFDTAADGEHVEVAGQIFPAGDVELYVVQAYQADREVGLTAADEMGEFLFTGLAPLAHTLVITGESVEIHLQAVDLTL